MVFDGHVFTVLARTEVPQCTRRQRVYGMRAFPDEANDFAHEEACMQETHLSSISVLPPGCGKEHMTVAHIRARR